MIDPSILIGILPWIVFAIASVFFASSSGIGINGNIGAAPIGIINNGANVYSVGEFGGSVPILREFVCNSMSACGMYDAGRISDGAIVNLGGIKRVKP